MKKLLLILLFILFISAILNAQIIRGGGQSTSLNRSNSGNNKFFAVGYWKNKSAEIGAIAVSDANGENWNVHTAPVLEYELYPDNPGIEVTIDPRVYGIAYANGTYIAVGSNGWSAWSTDGAAWNPVWIEPFSQDGQRDNNQDALTIATDGIRFFTGGTRGKLAWSQTGRSWTWIANGLLDGEYNDILCITYGNNKFIAAGTSGKIKSAEWDQATLRFGDGFVSEQIPLINSDINAVVWGGGHFLAVGNRGMMALSTDGSDWKTVDDAVSRWSESENIYSAVFGGDHFITGGHAKIVFND